jgi:hypothetical protein
MTGQDTHFQWVRSLSDAWVSNELASDSGTLLLLCGASLRGVHLRTE